MEPKKLIKTREPEGTQYSYRWRAGFFNIFGVVFAGVFLCSTAYSMLQILDSPPALLFSMIFLTVIGIVFYAQLCWCVNRTRFLLSRRQLLITSGPLPYPKSNRTVETKEIVQIYAQEYRGGGRGGGRQITTVILNRAGEEVILFNRWNNRKDPEYFAQEVRTYLNLQNPQEM